MEDVNAYLALTVDYGKGNDDSYSSGCGYGNGNDSNYSSRYGYGYGNGDGIGYGCISGSGGVYNDNAYDYNYRYDDGSGCGDGDGIKNFCGNEIYEIDGVQTILKRLHGSCAKGFILRSDLTLTPCYVIKYNNYFAHGKTLREAREAAFTKVMNNMPVEDRVAAFWKYHNRTDRYPVSDFFEWHNRLTGSCEMGRREFAKSHEIGIENGKMTVEEFINLTENDYSGEIIKKLRKCASGGC